MASNWYKIGEVYGNANGQSMFVCLICVKNAKSMDNVYNTSDASAFCWHIKQQHNSVNDAIEEQQPAKCIQCNSNYDTPDKYVENSGTIEISDDEEDPNLNEISTNLHPLLSENNLTTHSNNLSNMLIPLFLYDGKQNENTNMNLT